MYAHIHTQIPSFQLCILRAMCLGQKRNWGWSSITWLWKCLILITINLVDASCVLTTFPTISLIITTALQGGNDSLIIKAAEMQGVDNLTKRIWIPTTSDWTWGKFYLKPVNTNNVASIFKDKTKLKKSEREKNRRWTLYRALSQ